MAEFARLASSLLDFRGSRRRRQFEKPLRVAQFLRHHGFHRSLDSGRVVDLCLSWNGRNSKADVINTNNSSSGGGGGGSSHDLGSGLVLVHHDGLEAAVGYAASDGECQRVEERRHEAQTRGQQRAEQLASAHETHGSGESNEGVNRKQEALFLVRLRHKHSKPDPQPSCHQHTARGKPKQPAQEWVGE